MAIERGIITQEEYDAMWNENIVRWLCGEDAEERQKLLDRISVMETSS